MGIYDAINEAYTSTKGAAVNLGKTLNPKTVTVSKLDKLTVPQLQKAIKVLDDKLKEKDLPQGTVKKVQKMIVDYF